MSEATTSTIRRGRWRPRESRRTARQRRYLWRGFFTLVGVLLLCALMLALFQPFWHPNSKLVIIKSPSYPIGSTTPLVFSGQQLASLETLAPALYHQEGAEAPLVVDSLASVASVGSLGDQLRELSTGGSDVLMVYVAAHGIGLGDEPYLLCESVNPSQPLSGLVPLQEVLRQMARSPAKVKLLILDSGQLAFEPRWGILANDFPRLLPQAVRQVGSELAEESGRRGSADLWVLNSNSLFERSHGSLALQRTVFGFFVAEGLKGPADLNSDKTIDIGELHRFVSTQVDNWVRRYTAGNATQTPQLLTTAAAGPSGGKYPVLMSVTAFPKPARSLDMSKSLANARQASYTFSYLTGANTPASEYSLMMRAADPLLNTRAGNVLWRSYYASSRASNVAARQPRAPSASAAADGEAADGGSAEDGGTEQEKALSEEEEASRWIAVIGDLLAEGWRLRDMLSDDVRLGSVADIGPHELRAFEMQWVDLESAFRAGRLANAPVFAAMLQRRLAIVRHITKTADPEALPPEPNELTAWTGRSLRLPSAHSLGLLEAWSKRRGEELPEATRKLIDELDPLTHSGTLEAFREWVAKRTDQQLGLSEIHFAKRLANATWVSWPVAQRALRARRRAERVTAANPRLVRWCRSRLEQADRMRLRAERMLTETSGGANEDYALSLLRRADALYDEAEVDMTLVRNALEAEIRVSRQIPYHARWRNFVGSDGGGNAPALASVLALVESLQTLAELLNETEDPESRLTELRGNYAQLRRQEDLIAEAFEPTGVEPLLEAPPSAGSSWRIEAMMGTPLVAAPLRSALLTAGEQVDFQLALGHRLPTIPATAPAAPVVSLEQWSWLRQQNRLETKICELAGTALPDAKPQLDTIQRRWKRFATAHDTYTADSLSPDAGKQLWLATGELGSSIQTFYARLPDQIRSATRANRNLRDSSNRDNRVGALRGAQRALRWLTPQDAARVETPLPAVVLQRVDYYDELAWQLRRLRVAEAFASADELVFAKSASRPYRDPPQSMDDQPSLQIDRRPRIDVDAPDSISLISEDQRDFLVTFRNASPGDVACWVILRYADDLLDVRDPTQRAVLYHEPEEVSAKGYANPRPRATFVLPAGGSRTLRLRVIRRSAPPRPGQLAIMTIAESRIGSRRTPVSQTRVSQTSGGRASAQTLAADFSQANKAPYRGMLQESAEQPAGADTLAGTILQDQRYQRSAIDLQLPVPPSVVARVIGAPGTWSSDGNGLVLHPFANRDSDYRLRLVNRSGREKTVDVQLLAVRQRTNALLPDSELTYDRADRWLEKIGATDVLANVPDVALPADGTPVPVPFNQPPPGAAPGEKALGANPAAAGPAAAGPAAAGEASDDAKGQPSGPIVNEGLLLLLTDKQSRRKTFVPFTFAPQRPSRFLRAEASYDVNTEQLRVRITARDADLMPAGKVKIRGEFAQPLPSNVRVRLEGELESPHFETTLYANIPARPRRRVELRIHVDDYPRAFVFRVTCGRHAQRIPPEDQLMQVRIVEPQDDQAYQAPVESVRVKAQVDAPIGAFQNGNDFVEIGFDEDSDREFRDDQPLRFFSDRQAEIRLGSLQPDGLLRVFAGVGDFDVEVPGRGLQNVQVNLLARLVARKQEAWSVPVPIALDSAPPTIARIKSSGGLAVLGQPLKISVWADSDDLSGMAGAEAAFDTDGTGEFPETAPAIPAQPASGGRWEITLPTDQLAAGPVDVLIRVKDRVGNQSDPQSYAIVAVTKEEVARRKVTRVRVTGRVLYRDQPVPDATVTLQAADGTEYGPVQTDDQGVYGIENVPLGAYAVSARGVVNNTPRFPAEAMTLEVKASDGRVKRLDISIRPNRVPDGG